MSHPSSDPAACFDHPSPPLRTVAIGLLQVPSGELYCCDPFLGHEAGPLAIQVAPGAYPVDLCLRTMPQWGERVALARLRFHERKAVTWQEALYRRDGGLHGGFRVDAGMACFVDRQHRSSFVNTVNALYASDDNANYYDDVLAAEFKTSADPANPYASGEWAMHAPVPGDPGNLALFASGLGDGVYRAWWGLDAAGSPVALIADFGLIDADATHTGDDV